MAKVIVAGVQVSELKHVTSVGSVARLFASMCRIAVAALLHVGFWGGFNFGTFYVSF